jgi:predicted ATPase
MTNIPVERTLPGDETLRDQIAALLAACPALKVLVTSREPLSIRAEQQFALEPLGDAEAVQLFVERTQAVTSQLVSEGDRATTYSEICRRLDGLPLAIELIAARARTLSPIEMLRQLDRPWCTARVMRLNVIRLCGMRFGGVTIC